MQDYSNKFNPYSKKVQELETKIADLKRKIKEHENENEWAKTHDSDSLLRKIKGLSEIAKTIQLDMDVIQLDIQYCQIKLKENEENIKTIVNPLNLFSKEQRAFRKKRKSLKDRLGDLINDLNEITTKLNNNTEKRDQANNDLARSNGIDIEKNLRCIDALKVKLLPLNDELKKLLAQRSQVDKKVEPIIDKIRVSEIKLNKARTELKQAKEFDNAMGFSNSYERAMIHEQCKRNFGESSPRKVIRSKRNLISKLERDIEKLERRAFSVYKRSSRVIELLVIDGNNMCYENNNFVGIDPLILITSELGQRYDLVVVFDSDIRSILKKNYQMINSRFPKDVKVHIVASKEKADETIIGLTSNNKKAYVISNDRFSDYFDKEVIVNDRIIRHEMINNKVLIHDLDIDLTWN